MRTETLSFSTPTHSPRGSARFRASAQVASLVPSHLRLDTIRLDERREEKPTLALLLTITSDHQERWPTQRWGCIIALWQRSQGSFCIREVTAKAVVTIRPHAARAMGRLAKPELIYIPIALLLHGFGLLHRTSLWSLVLIIAEATTRLACVIVIIGGRGRWAVDGNSRRR